MGPNRQSQPSSAALLRRGLASRSATLLLCLTLLSLFLSCSHTAVLVKDGGAVEAAARSFPLSRKAQTSASERGMVVSGHPLASRAGAQILEQGGNAVDAAVAAGFALAAVLPRAGNLGGGGFLVYRSAAGEVRALDFRETAPAAASRDMYLDAAGAPTDGSVVGHLAVGVPGNVAGLFEMHRELGALPWSALLLPAIELARGHPVDEVRSAEIAGARDALARFPASAQQFLPGGEPPPPGHVWQQPDLVRTLERIAQHGPEDFYRGETAALLVAEMERGGGLVTRADLEAYRPVWRTPLLLQYRKRTIVSMPPPSSGGVTLGILLNVLKPWQPLPAFGSADLVQLEVEAMRRAFIDRNRYLGDPDFVAMPLERLLSREYAKWLRRGIVVGRATPTASLELALTESSETTHYSVVDGAGNAVALTTTLNGSFGSMVTVAGAGFLLNNEMDDFAAKPGAPNLYGLIQGEANAIAPGKRMLSSMTPSIVVDRRGTVELVVGSPGGPTIITTVFQVISNVIDHGMSLEQAVEAPRVHHQALPDRIFYEPDGLSRATLERLGGMGYELEERKETSGVVSAIGRRGGQWVGVADPRRGGGAAAPNAPEAADSRRGATEAANAGRPLLPARSEAEYSVIIGILVWPRRSDQQPAVF